ncbi:MULTISPECIES: BPSS1780 family membrane protein [Photorhabdus]|uniref:Transmembrane protein n=2 Tax=Photorhabdus TaxID=29487 RepID=A0ABX0AY51_9GAMM|nr:MULTISPECIES: BPSS1780 family membrane protein [Photorhabdus]MCC8374300.1 hypothetical protein [Photorhabdus bodei]MCT8353612.1 hypothetical protein [Photorhabdus kayaii]MDB6366548.1 BPSS1780 family membrane protein [Photorhabdus bodei]MDB6373662.1 BPSS1780 family membrane protein [Photorhabdus bodei]NDL12264.1 hypothetical protein [Photorhabdus kayaii]
MDNKNLSFNSNAIYNNQEVFIPGGQSLSSTEGMEWISQAWDIVKRKLGMWILLGIIYFIIISGLQLIPFLGIFTVLFGPVFFGGIIAVCEKQRTTGQFEIKLLFNGFQKNFVSLLGVGALSFGIILLGIVAMFIISSNTMAHILLDSQYDEIPVEVFPNDLSPLYLGAFVLLIFNIFGTALTWFAPALIVIHNLKFGAAISMSLEVVKKNLLPGFLFFMVMAIMFIISIMTLGLGLLITIPLFLVSYYSSYRSIFIGKEKLSSLIS